MINCDGKIKLYIVICVYITLLDYSRIASRFEKEHLFLTAIISSLLSIIIYLRKKLSEADLYFNVTKCYSVLLTMAVIVFDYSY